MALSIRVSMPRIFLNEWNCQIGRITEFMRLVTSCAEDGFDQSRSPHHVADGIKVTLFPIHLAFPSQS